MKRPEEPGPDFGRLVAEADARRQRLAGNLDELGYLLLPSSLMRAAKSRAWAEVDRMADEALDIAKDLVADAGDYVRENRTLVVGGGLMAVAAAALVWYATRRKPVPLYAAYDMEDPLMTDADETAEGLKQKAAGAWSRVKGEAVELSGKAEGSYYAARSRAAELSAEARERAADAAAVAREKAAEAAEAAREAAERAREAAGEAGQWAKRQPQENPATVVLVALAAGALIGALLPSGRRRDA